MKDFIEAVLTLILHIEEGNQVSLKNYANSLKPDSPFRKLLNIVLSKLNNEHEEDKTSEGDQYVYYKKNIVNIGHKKYEDNISTEETIAQIMNIIKDKGCFVSNSGEIQKSEQFKGVIELIEDSDFQSDFMIRCFMHLDYTHTMMSIRGNETFALEFKIKRYLELLRRSEDMHEEIKDCDIIKFLEISEKYKEMENNTDDKEIINYKIDIIHK